MHNGALKLNHCSYRVPVVAGSMIFVIILSKTPLKKYLLHKWMLIVGVACIIAECILMVFQDTADLYWQICFPSEILGALGLAIIYLTTT